MRHARKVWVILLALVLAFEGVALGTEARGDTLSEQVWALLEHSGARVLLGAFWAWLTFHFFAEPALRRWLARRGGPLVLALALASCGGGDGGGGGGGGGGALEVAPVPGITVDPATTAAELDLVAAAGIRNLRVPAWRDWWYPAAGDSLSPQQLELDAFMAQALPRGFRVLLVTAAIANAPGCSWDTPHDCATTVGRWHAELARRYPGLEGVEALNEVTAWPPFDRDRTEDYQKGLRIAPVLCAVRDSVKAVDPALLVVPGSGGDEVDYLRGLADGGAYPCLDAMVFHGYGDTQAEVAESVQRLRVHSDLPVWVTEFGVETGDDAHHAAVWRRGFEQTRGAVRLYAFALQAGGYGLVRPDGSPRPTYDWLVQRGAR